MSDSQTGGYNLREDVLYLTRLLQVKPVFLFSVSLFSLALKHFLHLEGRGLQRSRALQATRRGFGWMCDVSVHLNVKHTSTCVCGRGSNITTLFIRLLFC